MWIKVVKADCFTSAGLHPGYYSIISYRCCTLSTISLFSNL